MQHSLWIVLLLAAAIVAIPAKDARKESPVVATLEVSPQKPRLGQKLSLKLTVTNNTQQEQRLNFSSGQQHDFVVTSNGREVWRWGRGKFFTMALTQITLKPGQSRSFDAAWSQKGNDGRQVAAGAYAVAGIVTARPEIRTAPVQAQIIP